MTAHRGDPLRALAAAVHGRGAWLVGGAIRDRLLGDGDPAGALDYDVVVDGDPAAPARAVGRGAGGHAFELSGAFGTWRVVARDHSWQLDVLGLDGATLDDDLARRDLTINAIARALGDGAAPSAADADALIDPFGGVGDLRAGRLTMVSEHSFADDPLRVMRLARLGARLGFAVEPATRRAAVAAAPGLGDVAPERAFAELRALLTGEDPVRGLELLDALGATEVVLPELAALRGVTQSRYHHRDVHGHTLETLTRVVELVRDPGTQLALDDATVTRVSAALAQPLANELTRGQALRFAALLHDIAKPGTRAMSDAGRVTFMRHDVLGATLGSEILTRLRAADRLRAYIAALTRDHLRLGFLVHRVPLSRREVYGYLHACAPRGVDVTLLSVADRLATRGDNAEAAIAAHLRLAATMLPAALDHEAHPPAAPVRGDVLAEALGIAPGPRIAALLDELTAAAYAGEIDGPADAVALARRRLDDAR